MSETCRAAPINVGAALHPAAEHGLRVDALAQEYTTEGVVDALIAWFTQPIS